MGTFENNAANWQWIQPDSLWHVADDNDNCLPVPFPSGHKAMYFGKKASGNICNYATGQRTKGNVEMPFIKIDSLDARIRFHYYKFVRFTPPYAFDIFQVLGQVIDTGDFILWQTDSTDSFRCSVDSIS